MFKYIRNEVFRFCPGTIARIERNFYDTVQSQPLAGQLLAVKDCFCTGGIPTTCGSRMLSNYVPPYTATVAQKLTNNGCLVVGKTNLDEFCMGASSTESFFGPVKNPWTLKLWKNSKDLKEKINRDWYLAGGSSGGSAAAVASGLVNIALGSDTGGSTRNPAAFCGVVGYKPTYGLLSRHGLIPLTNSLDVPGIMARSVDQIALALDVAGGLDHLDSTSIAKKESTYVPDQDETKIKKLVIGLPEEYFVQGLSPSIVIRWKEVAALLENAGCTLKVVSLPHTRYSIICYHVLGECEISSNMARYDGVEYGYRADEDTSLNNMFAETRHRAFNDVVRRRILAGNYFLLRKNYEDFYVKSLKVRRLIAEDFYKVFRGDTSQKVDVLLTPVTLSEAPLYSQWKADDDGYSRERNDDYFTQSVNMAGVPAMSLPVGLSHGLPIGLQLIADFNEDKKLLTVARWIESQMSFQHLKRSDIVV